MDISDVTKTNPVSPLVANVAGASLEETPSATVGNSLPDAGQVRVSAKAPQVANSAPPSSSEELNKLVEQVNVTLQGRSSDLKFTVAEGTDISIVRIEDAETGELIRQVPSEAMVAIARALDEAQRGMMLQEKA